MRKGNIVAAALTILGIHSAQVMAAECDAPKPDFQLSAPGPSVSSGIATFNGVWAGTWTIGTRRGNEFLCVKMYVSVKDDSNADVAYCRGSLPDAGRLATCAKYDAKIDRGALIVRTQTFRVTGPSTLAAEGTQQGNGNALETVFHREH